ncbi:MAG: transglutaminase domain-containing protein [Huintestinicola sp.]|uniref:transglutaminase domain-containing protein n=1 Tax=Huintestinicola sp. TaxID=2981661 RepID=UPI003F0B759F
MSDELYEVKGYNKNEIALAELFKSTLESFVEEEVDISDFNVSYEEFEDIYTTVIMNEPELYYVNVIQASISYRTEDHILAFKPVYNCSYGQLDGRSKKIEKFSKSVMSGIKKKWSDEEKILYVHDRLAAHITYYKGSDTEYGRNIYDAFADRSAVCVGYSLGFQYFMDKLGIPCISVTTDDHIWNMVCVDGQWYHVDVTWDDSAEVTKNTVFHNMLLQSDEGMKAPGIEHAKAFKAQKADDSFYSDAFWTESNTRISYLNGYWYYTNGEGLNRYSFESGESRHIYDIHGVWHADKGRDWTVPFSQTAVYGKSVYFNSPDTIYRYDTVKKKIYKVYSPKLSGNEQIYDIYISDGKLIFSVGTYDKPAKVRKAIRLNKAA